MQRQQQSVGAIDFYVRQFVCKNHNIVKTVIDIGLPLVYNANVTKVIIIKEGKNMNKRTLLTWIYVLKICVAVVAGLVAVCILASGIVNLARGYSSSTLMDAIDIIVGTVRWGLWIFVVGEGILYGVEYLVKLNDKVSANIVAKTFDLDDLERLYKLKQDGVVTEEEFNKAKTMLFKQLDVNETSPKKTPKKQKKTNDAVSADGGAK